MSNTKDDYRFRLRVKYRCIINALNAQDVVALALVLSETNGREIADMTNIDWDCVRLLLAREVKAK